MSKAEDQANNILQAVQLLQKHNPKMSLCALDKNLLCGPGPSPDSLSAEELKTLKKLGLTWSEEQDAWEFYTGHG